MSLKLRRVEPDADPAALAMLLAPGFGGDPAPAREIIEQTVRLLAKDPRPRPWGSYLASHSAVTVGICAFKAAPDQSGNVEIAYLTFPAFERRGHATRMTAALVEIAAAGGARIAIAHTLPQVNASNKALKRNGFAFAGEVEDPEDGLVWRWEKALVS